MTDLLHGNTGVPRHRGPLAAPPWRPDRPDSFRLFRADARSGVALAVLQDGEAETCAQPLPGVHHRGIQ